MNRPPEQRGHPQVQSDVAQAQDVLKDHVQKLENQTEPLNEAQKKELTDAKATLSRLPAEKPVTTPENTQRQESANRPQPQTPDSATRPHGEADPDAPPSTVDPNRTPHADTAAEAPRSHGDSDARTHPAGAQPDAARPGRTPAGDAVPPRGHDSSPTPPSGRSSTARNDGDTTPYHPDTSADSPPATNPQTADRPTNGTTSDQVQNAPSNPSPRPTDNSRPPSPNTPGTPSAATANGSQPSSPSPASLPPPRTPPLSVPQSQRLINNVANMSPEARQHPQVQADLAQARSVVENQTTNRENTNSRAAGDTKSQSPDDANTSSSGKVQAAWKPSSHPEGSTDRSAADKWHKRLNSMRNMTNPVSVEEAISWRPEHPVTPDLQRKIFTATQTFLDMLPRNLVKDLGPVKLSVKASLDEGASGEYDYMTDTMALSHEKIKMYTPEELRGLLWHEMAHWLYYSAYLNPKAGPALKEWRAKIDAHWAKKTHGEIIVKHADGWRYIRDGLISDYAGRLYPGQDGGIEIPSVYLGEASLGPDNLADLCERFPGEEETFNLVMSIFNN